MTYDLIFMTTCIDDRYIRHLMGSISENNNILHVCVIVLLQNNVTLDVSSYNTEYTHVILLHESKKLTLSVARNRIIGYVKENSLYSKYIMFPDDDSSFDTHFFKNFNKVIVGNSLIDVFCYGTRKHYQTVRCAIAKKETYDYRAAMSVNMVITYNTFLQVGSFDEKMGVGALYGAGEDGDYFIRACLCSNNAFKLVRDLWNFHPSPNYKYKSMSLQTLKKRYRNYGEGVIYLCYKHKLYSQAIFCIFSGIVGTFTALLLLNFKLFIARFYSTYSRLKLFLQLCFNGK